MNLDIQLAFFDYVLDLVKCDVRSDERWLKGRSIQFTRDILLAYLHLGAPKGVDPIVASLKPLFLKGDDPEVRTAESLEIIGELVQNFHSYMANSFEKLLKDEEVYKEAVLVVVFDVLKSLADREYLPFYQNNVHHFLRILNLVKLFRDSYSDIKSQMIIIKIVTYFDYNIDIFLSNTFNTVNDELMVCFGENAHYHVLKYLLPYLSDPLRQKRAFLLLSKLNLDPRNQRLCEWDSAKLYGNFWDHRSSAVESAGELLRVAYKEKDLAAVNTALRFLFHKDEHKPQIAFFPEVKFEKNMTHYDLLLLYLLQDAGANLNYTMLVLNYIVKIGYSPCVFEEAKKVLEAEKEFTVLKATALFLLSVKTTCNTFDFDELMEHLSKWRNGKSKEVDTIVRELLMVVEPTESIMIFVRGLCENHSEYLPCLAKLVRMI